MNTDTKSIWLPQAIVIATLMAAPFLMDSDVYFGLLKLVCCPVFAYLAYHAWKLKKMLGFGFLGLPQLYSIPLSGYTQFGTCRYLSSWLVLE